MLTGVRRLGQHREPGQAQLRGLGHREHQRVERLDEIDRVERAVVGHAECGGDDRVLRGCVGHGHHHLLGEVEPVHQRTVDLRQGAQPERVLDPGRRCLGVDDRPHRPAHPACTRERGGHLDCWAERLRVAVDRGEPHRSDDHEAACEPVDVRNRQRRVAEHSGVARHECECVASAERGGVRDRRVVGLLAGQHQGSRSERCQVRRTDAAALAHRRQRVRRDHVGQRFQNSRIQAVAVGGKLVEPDQQHRADSLRRARVTRAGRV